jgi:hypothetical protein
MAMSATMAVVARSGWWSKTRGLPRPVYDSWQASMADGPPRPSRVLAWGEGEGGHVIGSAAALSYGVSDSWESDGWTHVGWHEIERGGWNAETGTLSWSMYGGRRGRLALSGPGRLPELFRERVAASIVVERFVPISGDRGVVVNGRRNLAGPAEISWHATLGRGLTWRTPGLRDAVETAMADLRTEYDPGRMT